MRTLPPVGVNLIALETRLSSICLNLPASASMSPMPVLSASRWICFCVVNDSTVLRTWSIISETDSGWIRSSICPASILDRSRMSLMSPSRCLPLVWICCRNLKRVVEECCPSGASISSSEKPRIALRGVLSSWLMLARNTLLCLFASTSCELASFNLSSSRARSRAAATAVMNCWTRLISSVPKPGVNGPASTARRPSALRPPICSRRRDVSAPPRSMWFTPWRSGTISRWICAI